MRPAVVKMLTAAVVGALCTGGVVVVSLRFVGDYGWALFAGAPFLLGFASTAFFEARRPAPLGESIKVAMAIPLGLPIVLLGCVGAHYTVRCLRRAREAAASMTVLIAVLAIFEPHGASRVNVVEDSVLVRATPERTWQTIVNLSDVAPSHDFLFRAGIACPRRAKIVRPGVGGERVCTLTTGVLVERIDDWRPGERLGWRAVNTPPPMHELNPFHEVDAPHGGEPALERIAVRRPVSFCPVRHRRFIREAAESSSL